MVEPEQTMCERARTCDDPPSRVGKARPAGSGKRSLCGLSSSGSWTCSEHVHKVLYHSITSISLHGQSCHENSAAPDGPTDWRAGLAASVRPCDATAASCMYLVASQGLRRFATVSRLAMVPAGPTCQRGSPTKEPISPELVDSFRFCEAPGAMCPIAPVYPGKLPLV